MPERVESMVQTARKVAQLQSEGKLPDLAIFVSGAAHLKKMKDIEDNSYSLDSFYTEISKHKSVVLFQKDIFKDYF